MSEENFEDGLTPNTGSVDESGEVPGKKKSGLVFYIAAGVVALAGVSVVGYQFMGNSQPAPFNAPSPSMAKLPTTGAPNLGAVKPTNPLEGMGGEVVEATGDVELDPFAASFDEDPFADPVIDMEDGAYPDNVEPPVADDPLAFDPEAVFGDEMGELEADLPVPDVKRIEGKVKDVLVEENFTENSTAKDKATPTAKTAKTATTVNTEVMMQIDALRAEVSELRDLIEMQNQQIAALTEGGAFSVAAEEGEFTFTLDEQSLASQSLTPNYEVESVSVASKQPEKPTGVLKLAGVTAQSAWVKKPGGGLLKIQEGDIFGDWGEILDITPKGEIFTETGALPVEVDLT